MNFDESQTLYLMVKAQRLTTIARCVLAVAVLILCVVICLKR
jgi:hypothetical protein